MDSSGSVTEWIGQLKRGDISALSPLWRRYFERLLPLARRRLGTVRRHQDEEDVVLSAFDSFAARVQKDDLPQLVGRDDLWALLAVITVRKAINARVREGRQKRGGGRVHGDSVGAEPGLFGLHDVLASGPGPEDEVVAAELFESLLGRLGSADLRTVALEKLRGLTNAEIASRLLVSERTIERKLQLIRDVWNETG